MGDHKLAISEALIEYSAQRLPRMRDPRLKKCQTCSKMLPRVGPVACAGRCMELFVIRRNNFKKTQKYKDGQSKYWKSDKGKASKARRAKTLNATPRGKEIKRRADAKMRSTVKGRLHRVIQERLRLMGRSGDGYVSSTLRKWMGFDTMDAAAEWIERIKPDDRPFAEFDLDHNIPFYAYTWKRVGDAIVREREVPDDEMRKLWNPDNLQLLYGNANQEKGSKLPSSDILLKLRHLWPSWWEGVLPTDALRSSLESSKRKRVLV